MTTDNVEVKFHCKQCGELLTWSDNITDADEVRCKKCGQYFGTYLDLRNAATQAVRDKAAAMIKDILKR
jgi:DNA-directed RNA polymerase subunit RPC12/RpoP